MTVHIPHSCSSPVCERYRRRAPRVIKAGSAPFCQAVRAAKAVLLGGALLVLGGGCVLTRAVTAPMRVGGAMLTIIPGVGDAAHSTVDTAAAQIDDIPL